MENSLAYASLIKVNLWKKSVQPVPGLGFWRLAEEDPLRRCLTPGLVFKSYAFLPPRDFLETEQSLSKLNSQLFILQERSLLFCQLDASDFQQQTEPVTQGLREEDYPKNTFLFARK